MKVLMLEKWIYLVTYKYLVTPRGNLISGDELLVSSLFIHRNIYKYIQCVL